MTQQEHDKLLFDLIFRHQVYLEGVKFWIALQYARMLKRLSYRFIILFNHSNVSTLDQFSKRQLNEFLRLFQREQAIAYNDYVKQTTKALKEFVAIDVDASDAIFNSVGDSAAFESMFGTVAASKLWDKFVKEPMPANGKYPLDGMNDFVTSAMNNTLAIIRQGYANNFTPQQTQAMIIGNNGSTFKDGLFARLNAQNAALMATTIQYLSTNAQAAVASTYYDKYQWISVMDTHTTQICADRNGNVYVYGEGPLPPAWYNCRSHVSPLIGDTNELPTSYKTWLAEQPSDLQRFVAAKTELNLAEFAAKMKSILQ